MSVASHETIKRLRVPRVAIFALGVALLVAAWIGATPPFGGPDEASHYQRAVGIAYGSILGAKVHYGHEPQLTPTQLAFIDHDTRAIRVPSRLSPTDVVCVSGAPDRNGSCLEADPSGNFPPIGYLLPAMAIRASADVTTGSWLTRISSALQSTAFLLLALVLLWSVSGWSLLGFSAAISPMVLFGSSVLNPSGLEISACLAFAACVLRITREPARTPGWLWLVSGVAGAIGILAGPIGLVFVIADLVLFVALLGLQRLRALWAVGQLRICGGILLAAAALAIVYSRLAGFSTKIEVSLNPASLGEAFHQLGPVLRGGVGNFASLTVPLPTWASWIWWLMIIVMSAVALALGDLRERSVLMLSVVLVLAFPVLFWAWSDRFSGFGLEGREVLPLLMLIPLVAGEIIFRHRSAVARRRSSWFALASVLGLMAVLQGYAWWLSARAAAGAAHTVRFYAHAIWRPPLGWLPWILAAAVGVAALLSFAVGEAIRGGAISPKSRARGRQLKSHAGEIA